MDVLIRHTILGDWMLRLLSSSYLNYAEERDPAMVKKFTTLQNASDLPQSADEHTALINNREGASDSEIFLVDWYDENDAENPLNWPLRTRVTVTTAVFFITIALYTGSSFWSVSIEEIKSVYQVSDIVCQLGTSFFVLGIGFGPMIWSPLSEMPSIGRLKVYFWTAIAYIVCQLILTLCDNFETMLVMRFLTGFLCSPILAVGGGTVADMFGPSSRGYPLAVWELGTWGASALGPVFAGFTFQRFGYKGPMWELVFLGLLGFVLIICFLPETLPAAILHQRAERLRKVNQHSRYVTYNELEEAEISLVSVIRKIFVKSITLNFQEPIVLVLNLYVALVFAIFFGMLESYPRVFKNEPYNFNSGQTGLTFLGIFAGGSISMILYLLFLFFYQDHCFDEGGNIRPEERLLPAIPGGFFVPLGLFWYAWTTHLHWIMPVLGGFWYGLGMFTIFMAALSYLPDAYPSVAATVLAGNCLMRAALAASFPLFTNQYYQLLGTGIATSILAALGLLFVPWPIYLYYRGHNVRMRSPNARKDI